MDVATLETPALAALATDTVVGSNECLTLVPDEAHAGKIILICRALNCGGTVPDGASSTTQERRVPCRSVSFSSTRVSSL